MFEQICFFRTNPEMTTDQLEDYYEQHHWRLSGRTDGLPSIIADYARLFASHADPVSSVVEFDSAMGPNSGATRVEVRRGV